MKKEKKEGKERGKFSGFANREKFPGYAIAKKIHAAPPLSRLRRSPAGDPPLFFFDKSKTAAPRILVSIAHSLLLFFRYSLMK